MFRFVNFDRNTTIVNCQITSKKPSARCLMAICVISALAILVYSYTLTTPCRLVKASQSFRRINFKTETLFWKVTLSPAWLAPSSLCLGCLFLTPEFHFYAELVQKGDCRNSQELSPHAQGQCLLCPYRSVPQKIHCTGQFFMELAWQVTSSYFTCVTLPLNPTIHLPILQKYFRNKKLIRFKKKLTRMSLYLSKLNWGRKKII